MRDFDMEVLKNHLRWNKRAIIFGLLLGVCIFGLAISDWSGATGWFMFPIIGTVVSAVFTGIGIYDGQVQRIANDIVQKDRTPSPKAQLKAMYKEREKLAKNVYEYRDRPRYIEDQLRDIRRLDKKIAIHRGLLPED